MTIQDITRLIVLLTSKMAARLWFCSHFLIVINAGRVVSLLFAKFPFEIVGADLKIEFFSQ